MEQLSGCTFLWEVHPASAQNKSLISDTGIYSSQPCHTLFLRKLVTGYDDIMRIFKKRYPMVRIVHVLSLTV